MTDKEDFDRDKARQRILEAIAESMEMEPETPEPHPIEQMMSRARTLQACNIRPRQEDWTRTVERNAREDLARTMERNARMCLENSMAMSEYLSRRLAEYTPPAPNPMLQGMMPAAQPAMMPVASTCASVFERDKSHILYNPPAGTIITELTSTLTEEEVDGMIARLERKLAEYKEYKEQMKKAKGDFNKEDVCKTKI